MRTHAAQDVNKSLLNQSITLCGWVHRRRDHGGLIFIDLRDRNELVQIVCDPAKKDTFDVAQKLRNEFVIRIIGLVRNRPDGTINKEISSGDVEIDAQSIEILNAAEPLPFNVDDYQEVGEEARLKYRYLDLRRAENQNRLKKRAQIVRFIRQFLDAENFNDIETPFLTKTTPEGARDYLVPSRNYPGKFYALPQSPQIFKQLLMMSGFDRCYQIVKCFRDEDLRADRQPEFTQLDVEMSFVNESDVQNLMEKMVRELWKTAGNVDLPAFPRMTFHDAMRDYGSDKPDLRNPLKLMDIKDLMKNVAFKVFHGPANDINGRVTVLKLPQQEVSRKQIDDYTQFVAIYGAKGLAYIKVTAEGLQSPIFKFIPDNITQEIVKRTKAETGDVLFFSADHRKIVSESLGALR